MILALPMYLSARMMSMMWAFLKSIIAAEADGNHILVDAQHDAFNGRRDVGRQLIVADSISLHDLGLDGHLRSQVLHQPLKLVFFPQCLVQLIRLVDDLGSLQGDVVNQLGVLGLQLFDHRVEFRETGFRQFQRVECLAADHQLIAKLSLGIVPQPTSDGQLGFQLRQLISAGNAFGSQLLFFIQGTGPGRVQLQLRQVG